DCPPPSPSRDHIAVINQFALAGNAVIMSAGFGSRYDLNNRHINTLSLYRMTSSCDLALATKLDEEVEPNESLDFDVSPDGLSVVFSSNHGQLSAQDGGLTPQHEIFIVASDGGGLKKLAGDPFFEDLAPFLVSGGR